MTTYAVFLRGVNVGSARRVAMADVRRALADAGYPSVATYLQSGNLVVGSASGASRLARDVEAALRSGCGLDADAIVRSSRQLTAIVDANPYPVRNAASVAVGFATKRPSAAAARALVDRDFGDDRAIVRGADVYLLYPNGQGRSKMTSSVLERVLSVRLTVRNWKVTTEMRRLASGQ